MCKSLNDLVACKHEIADVIIYQMSTSCCNNGLALMLIFWKNILTRLFWKCYTLSVLDVEVPKVLPVLGSSRFYTTLCFRLV